MSIKKFIKSTIRKCDLFSQQVTFRYNDEPAYETVTGGCVSIIMIIAFVGIFATTLLRTVEKQYINFNLSKHDESSPSYFATTLDKNFLFAVGLDNIDLNSGQRYFDIYMEFRHYHGTVRDKTTIPLTQCEREPWEERGYGQVYDKLKLSKWLCPQEGTQIQLEGKFSSDSFKFYKIAAKKCSSSLVPSRPCASTTTIETYLSKNQAFNFNYYFINTIINPGDETYLSTYLEDVNYFPFSTTNGVNANLFISSYTIETDESLWPTQDMNYDEGGIVLDSSQVMNFQVRGTDYMKLFLRKSPISLSIQRSFRKVDDTFSYIGGLFSTILVFFGFINLYNELSYEIAITKSIYYYDKNDPFDGDHFNLITHTGYYIFCLFDKVGIELPWPRFQRLHRFLQEGRKHLDIRLIMQKIIYGQKLGLAILDKTKHKALLLSQPFTLDEADQSRKDLKFYKQFRKKFFPKGQTVQQNLDILTKDIANPKSQLQSSLMTNPNNSTELKIFPSAEQSIIVEPTSTEFLDYGKQGFKRKQTQITNKQDQFCQMDFQIRQCLYELQEQVQAGDQLAKKIMDNIDPRIRTRYLGKRKTLRPLKINPKKKTQSDINHQL